MLSLFGVWPGGPFLARGFHGSAAGADGAFPEEVHLVAAAIAPPLSRVRVIGRGAVVPAQAQHLTITLCGLALRDNLTEQSALRRVGTPRGLRLELVLDHMNGGRDLGKVGLSAGAVTHHPLGDERVQLTSHRYGGSLVISQQSGGGTHGC